MMSLFKKSWFQRSSVIVLSTALLTGALAWFLTTIFQRKLEEKNPFFRVVELDDTVEDPEIWGKNFPLQYDGYRRTVDQIRTRYGGSEARARTPTLADPRSVVAQSRLEEDPRLRILWDGYAFSKDFREERGHAYMLEDQTYTERQRVTPQPGTCVHCHASVYSAYLRLGSGDLHRGFDRINHMSYFEARRNVKHAIACIDCHDPRTLQLRITRPAFIEGIRALKASEGVRDYHVNRDASRQEMRSFVCAQCHVEYYFQGPTKRLVYPWAQGVRVDQIYDYYRKHSHSDWSHARTGAKVLKAQHPEFEMWRQGIHARSGVSCADCHMPYYREGAQKISDHHVRSPVLNINRACQTCHHWPEQELKDRIETIQNRTFELRNRAMSALVEFIGDIERAKKSGRSGSVIAQAEEFQRHAQFYLDFVEAENSTGFHAPQEAVRILGESIDYTRQGQNLLR